ncbi:putative hydrophobic protein (TIGR00271 family) [Paraburkholderia sp. GAS448]|uniref:DUF389 domain-containing protein n=1 Tax=Paraburkholderia sp. GAS448 TaxID=3035136 RepID=UPI003D1B2096
MNDNSFKSTYSPSSAMIVVIAFTDCFETGVHVRERRRRIIRHAQICSYRANPNRERIVVENPFDRLVRDEQQAHRQRVREDIYQAAVLSPAFLLMNGLATTIATCGLLQDSPAVIIGAMLIAMLLGPVMGVALALLESDFMFLSKSLLAAGVGVVEVMAIAFIIGLATRDIAISHEIMARTAPNLLDLIVALVGGAAVAYATVTPRLSVALVGVAIATALVPPLAASSILLAHGQTRLALGAVLLTFTNMVAIQLASSIVLWVHGYQKSAEIPRNAKVQFLKGHAISIFLFLVLSVVLAASLHRVVVQHQYEVATRAVLQQGINATPGNYLADVRFDRSGDNVNIIRAVVRGPNPPSAAQVAALEAQLPRSPDLMPSELRIRFVRTMIINPHGLVVDHPEDNSE